MTDRDLLKQCKVHWLRQGNLTFRMRCRLYHVPTGLFCQVSKELYMAETVSGLRRRARLEALRLLRFMIEDFVRMGRSANIVQQEYLTELPGYVLK